MGLEGESAAEEVLLLCHREAAAGSQLLSLTGSRAGGLLTLAALAESADWVADYLAHMAANSGPGGCKGGERGRVCVCVRRADV